MMQVIAGIHFNFSFSQSFWQIIQNLQPQANEQPLNDFISDQYFSILRNYKRYCWLIPYLYGASPAYAVLSYKVKQLRYHLKNHHQVLCIYNTPRLYV